MDSKKWDDIVGSRLKDPALDGVVWHIDQINLAISSSKCHPRRARPPSDDKAKEPCILRSCTFRGPDVDRAAQGESRTDLSEHRSSCGHENHGKDKWRPDDLVNLCPLTLCVSLPHGCRSTRKKSQEQYRSALWSGWDVIPRLLLR